MGVTITYSILFEVKILHHYFLNKGVKNFATMTADKQAEMMLLYDMRDIFHITPTAQSKKDLDRHRCLFKQTATGCIVGMKAEIDKGPPKTETPFHHLDDDLILTFHIHLRDYNLLNYTALPLTGNAGRIYLFSNRKGAGTKRFPSLCALPDTFSNGSSYLPGDMVVNNTATPTKLWTARLKTNANPVSSADWLTENQSEGLPMSYANENDRYQLVRQQLLYTVKTANVEPDIVIKTAAGTVVEVKSDIFPGEFRTIQLDLRGLPEGLYSFHAESQDHTYQDDLHFYLLQQQEVPFAILQLTVKSDSATYNMLDSQGHMLSPVYELRFRNRATHWRFIGKSFNASSVTASPLPLTRFGSIDNVSVPDKNGIPVDDLPNPEVTMIKAEALTVEAEKKFYSEVHIH